MGWVGEQQMQLSHPGWGSFFSHTGSPSALMGAMRALSGDHPPPGCQLAMQWVQAILEKPQLVLLSLLGQQSLQVQPSAKIGAGGGKALSGLGVAGCQPC